ncbi:DUF1329 domain-containing protein [Thalassotalea sp. LPB0316]|uniref:DUF1329 domain-containing protein n=1 Tax=Thalassotalea sp. LPB0316 TaxID=2769490 RepID=UPI001868E29B|nr:DUF1329 domain-containing protein [Thalassotalea sp. LPB0316]QOL26341.1 DUF1329 domain-containing protein [Thalassotalea sp. LPB0316]
MKNLFKVTGLLSITLIASAVNAKVSPQEAAKLGSELTYIGAEKAGNAAGTIPAYTGGLTSTNTPKSEDSGRPNNPFPNDKVLFTITNSNLDQYKANLSPGQIAMFEKYPSYRMPVYQTRRTAAYPASLHSVIKKNAENAELIQGGNGLANFDTTIPFAIPQNANEVIWNHITRYRGGSARRFLTTIPAQADGSFVPVKMNDQLVWPEFLDGGRDAKKDDNILFYYLQVITAPARLTGTALMVHETIDQVSEARKAWVYNAGQRRVRRAPNVSYDGPAAGTDGLRTSDNYDMYNGAPDRYDWKLVGKKELYIPYNSYQLMDTSAKYKDLIQAGHLNPDYLRYELHRVWEVEGTLKEGARHIYAKRTLFIDEDTWGASVIDHYDGRGDLWRVAEAHNVQFYDVDTPWMVAEALYDLNSGRYITTGLSNEEPKFMVWGEKNSRKAFSTSALRRIGK